MVSYYLAAAVSVFVKTEHIYVRFDVDCWRNFESQNSGKIVYTHLAQSPVAVALMNVIALCGESHFDNNYVLSFQWSCFLKRFCNI